MALADKDNQTVYPRTPDPIAQQTSYMIPSSLYELEYGSHTLLSVRLVYGPYLQSS